jgi:hypothetical protein
MKQDVADWPYRRIPARLGLHRALATVCAVLVALGLCAALGGRPRASQLSVTASDLVMPRAGTYQVERPRGAVPPFQWTGAQGVFAVANPGGPVTVRLGLLGGPAGPTPIRLQAEQMTMQFVVQPGLRRYNMLLPPVGGERLRLQIDAPTTHIARRDLGVAVSTISVAGGQRLPATLVLALLAASVASTTLARGRRLYMLAGLALLQLAAVWWWAAGGWSYGTLGAGLAAISATGATAWLLGGSRPQSRREQATGGRAALMLAARLGLTTVALAAGLLLLVDRDVLPLANVLGLAVATAGGYALLRQTGLSAAAATVGVALLQAVLLASQALLGWGSSAQVGLVATAAGGLAAAAAVLERWSVPVAPREGVRRAWRAWDVWIALALASAALLVRVAWLPAPDPVGDIELAARRMGLLQANGLAGAYTYEGDYMPLWMYTVYALSYLVTPLGGAFFEPLPAITRAIVKLPSVLADTASVVLIYAWGRRWAARREAALIAALYTLSPPVWINSAWWGQADTLLMLPLIGALVLLDRAGGRWSWLCWAIALATKPQAIVFAPVLAVATLRRYGCRGVLAGGAIALAARAAAAAPLVAAGQGGGLLYASVTSIGRFPRVSNGAYNLGYLLTGGQPTPDAALWLGVLSYRMLGLILLSCVALLICVGLLRRADALGRVGAGAALALAFFMLPTQIHERYLFLPLASLALCIPLSRRYLLPYLALAFSATLNIVGDLSGFVPWAAALIRASPLPGLLALANGVALVLLVWRLYARGPARGADTSS